MSEIALALTGAGALLALWLAIEVRALWCGYREIAGHRTMQVRGFLVRPLLLAFHQRLHRSRAKQQRLVHAIKMIRSLGRAIPEALVVINTDDQIVWSNQRAIELLGIERKHRGALLASVLPEKIAAWFSAGANAALIDVDAVKQGVKLWVKLALLPQAHRLLMARDATAMARAAQVRRDFVANVSHELRTPLTVINGYLDAIEPEEAPEFAGPIEQMRKQGLRMAQIVEDLLTLARLEREEEGASDDSQRNDLIAMQPLLQQLLLEAQRLSQAQHQISLNHQLEMDVLGNERDLRSAFTNLISNAVRYTPAGGKIQVAWRWHAEGAVFEVIDSGHGIPAEHLPRLTERFYRVSTSRSRESGGTGLGLAIVNHVLTVHGARLEIASELGRGSRFACVLPRARLRVS